MSNPFVCFLLFGVPIVLLVHEVGHLIAARWFGVQVLRLSIGVGPEVLTVTDWNGTCWKLAVLPLGGSMEMSDGCSRAAGAAAHAFSELPRSHRIAIYAAGPLLNLLFAGGICGCSRAIFGEGGSLLATHFNGPTVEFLSWIAGFSFCIALFSLVPIPPLDGGWIALLAFEALAKRPMAKRTQKRVHTIGIAMVLAATMILFMAIADHLTPINSIFRAGSDIYIGC